MSEIVVIQKDLGSIIETCRGDVIVLRLGENLTTGYRWEVKTEGSGVELIESTYVEAPEGIGPRRNAGPALRGEVSRKQGDPPEITSAVGSTRRSSGAPGYEDPGAVDPQEFEG